MSSFCSNFAPMKKIVIGIDVGISTTKIVGIDDNGMVISPIRIKATDPITSLYGAFGKYLHDNKISLNEVEHVMLTGVGAAYIDEPIYGLPTSKSQEFVADGLGARYESKLDRMIVVSMGTGTSLVKCDGDEIKHIGGIGIGGGTLAGLSRIMLKTDDIKQIVNLAKDGDISKINLLIGDISAKPLPGLPMPSASLMSTHSAVSSTWPWTMCPSRRPLTCMDLSTLTLSPTFSCPMFERSSVSFIAVTVYWSPLMFTTVRQTPLWQTLWSIFSSLVNEHVKVRSTFPPYRFMATMVAISSTIPLNMAFFKY